MAVPSAPTGVTIKAGKHPGEVAVTWTAAAGSPTSYTCYVYPRSTVSNLLFTGKRPTTKLIAKFRGLKNGGMNKQMWAVVTASNASGESTPSSTAHCTPFQNPGLGTGGANA